MKKVNRVRKNEEFQVLIRQGKKKTSASFVMYCMPKKEEQARIGISLSKKIGNAVVRNKIKRQVRMMCQELITFEDYPYDVILIVRHVYKNNKYADNKNILEKVLYKAKM
ncbi:MAG: ribonuclease P protein component [Solobacterium sp.]|nr:ribonuclease P protein component [Solobacterium sp.]